MKKRLTLIEMLLAIMLLVFVLTLVEAVFHVFSKKPTLLPEDEQDLSIQNALIFYKLDNGFYPTREQGLDALVHKPVKPPIPAHWRPYLKKIPEKRPIQSR